MKMANSKVNENFCQYYFMPMVIEFADLIII